MSDLTLALHDILYQKAKYTRKKKSVLGFLP